RKSRLNCNIGLGTGEGKENRNRSIPGRTLSQCMAADEELRRCFPVVELSAARIKAVFSETAREKR
ncbi:hypothetical protein A2U01_0084139, partial [Trifolium medium]|nr:hypothetical protein [Trifolium medium]